LGGPDLENHQDEKTDLHNFQRLVGNYDNIQLEAASDKEDFNLIKKGLCVCSGVRHYARQEDIKEGKTVVHEHNVVRMVKTLPTRVSVAIHFPTIIKDRQLEGEVT
jgi:hypothetical protein